MYNITNTNIVIEKLRRDSLQIFAPSNIPKRRGKLCMTATLYLSCSFLLLEEYERS